MSIAFFILYLFINSSNLYSSQNKSEENIIDRAILLIVKNLAPNDPSRKLTREEFSDGVDHRLKISIAISTATILVILIKLIRKTFSNKKTTKKSNLTEPNKQEGLSKEELFKHLILDTINKPTNSRQQDNENFLIEFCQKLEPLFIKKPSSSKIKNPKYNDPKSGSIIENPSDLSESTASTMTSDKPEEGDFENNSISNKTHLPLLKNTDTQTQSSPIKYPFPNQKVIQPESEKNTKATIESISKIPLESTKNPYKAKANNQDKNQKSKIKNLTLKITNLNKDKSATKINPPKGKNQDKNILNDPSDGLPKIPDQLKYKNLCRDPQCPHKMKLHEHHFYNQNPTRFTKRIPLVFLHHTFRPVKPLHKNLIYKQIPIQFIKKVSIVVFPTQTLHQVKPIVYNEIPYINRIAPFNNIINPWKKIRV